MIIKNFMKKIYVNYYAPTLHSMYNEMLLNPPEWFEYILKSQLDNWIVNTNIIKKAYSLNKIDFFWKFNKKFLSKFINTVKIKDNLYPYLVIPKNWIDLIYSAWYIVKKKIPWIIDMEVLHVLNWYNLEDLKRNKKYYQRYLESDYCKWITVWNSYIYDSIIDFFHSDIIKNKTSIIRHTIKANNFIKEILNNNENINFLFLGSWNILSASYVRWIKDALIIYRELLKKHDNISLKIAPFLPEELKEEFWSLKWLIISDKLLNRDEMNTLYSQTDILLHPSYSNPAMTLLEAMNHGISILTTNYWWLSDLVVDWYNWLICKNNSLFDYYWEYKIPRADLTEQVMKYSWLDNEMISDFVNKSSNLIDNIELRKTLALNSKKTLLEWEFNFECNNEKLKKIYNF